MTKKTYRVSIAMRVPISYEARVQAATPEEARKLAYKAWEDHTGELDEHSADWGEAVLNVDEDDFKTGIKTSGVHIAEVDTLTGEWTEV